MTELVTDGDETRDEEATTTSNNGVVTFGAREPQLARARDASERTAAPDGTANLDADSDALRGFYAAAARAGEGLRMTLAGPAAWPLITRRHPSVAEVFRHGRLSPAWDHPALLVRWPARAFWTADALWETGCMTARVWWRTKITWAITILLFAAWLAWGH